jgi:ABC-type polysaccharide/polyol phosphate export permease
MGATLKNMMTFAPQNVTAYAWLPLILVWLVIVGVMVTDIIQTSGSRLKGFLWILITILLPGVAAIVYAIFGIIAALRKSALTAGQ